ncbi:hypothetical protein LEP1GSC029_3402 [Leptospira interrogans str. 2002000626]|uniref:Uncharacterized protein n=2 Tax=Leptospira interrogans TaxID=173 RepID=A0A829D936_LEPIR|nr:hypothetical protein LEP1GSC029_3402 [Leptospira interrogans str. 2002000626]EMY24166.1 hypothetical protein LEP1GSC115_2913 [Leptospira interrogans serovar Australis str. 200703203]
MRIGEEGKKTPYRCQSSNLTHSILEVFKNSMSRILNRFSGSSPNQSWWPVVGTFPYLR